MTQAWLTHHHKVNLKDIDQIEFYTSSCLYMMAAELLQYDTLLAIVRSAAKLLVYRSRQRTFTRRGIILAQRRDCFSIFQTIPSKNGVRFANNVEMPMSEDTACIRIDNVPSTPFTGEDDVNKEVKPLYVLK